MKRFRSLPTLFAASLLTACGGHALERPQPPVEAVASATAAKAAIAYPGVALDGNLLYDLLVAEIAAPRGHYDVAVDALVRSATETRDPRLAERATLVAQYAKNYQQALPAAELWVSLQPDHLAANEAMAEILLQLHRTDEASAQFKKVLSLSDPANVGQVYLKMAAALARYQDRPAALRIMESLTAAHPEKREAHFALAHLAVRTGNLESALAAIDKALALTPGWEEAALFKARVLVSKKDTQEALVFFDEYLREYPQATNFRLNYARYLVEVKQWNQARAQFKRVVAETPQDADAVYAVGLLALQSSQFDEAKKYLQLHLQLNRENDQARLYLGQIAEEERDYAEAARWYGAIEGEALHFEAQARYGILLASQGDLAAAQSHLRAIHPRTQAQRVQLVLSEDQILRSAKKYDESLKLLSGAIEHMADETDLLYARALVAEKLNMLDVHEADLRTILAKDPKNANALNALGYTLADRTNRHEEALTLIAQALALKPDDPYILDSMGWLQYRMGNSAEAVKLLRRALSIRNDAEISAHLGEVLWVTGDRAGAESVWRDALKETPDHDVLLDIIKKFKP